MAIAHLPAARIALLNANTAGEQRNALASQRWAELALFLVDLVVDGGRAADGLKQLFFARPFWVTQLSPG
jgi:hypothetical protein